MTTIKVENGMDINVESIWSTSGTDMQKLLIFADNDARHGLAIKDGVMLPYATQISIMTGELESLFKVGVKSLFQVDVIVFSDTESELRYHSLQESSNFTIKATHLQNK